MNDDFQILSIKLRLKMYSLLIKENKARKRYNDRLAKKINALMTGNN